LKKLCLSVLLIVFFIGCASKVRFIKIDESYVEKSKSKDAEIVFTHQKIHRPLKVIGIIEAHLGKEARRCQLDALLKDKVREIGADGIMLVEYDIDPTVYIERHHTVVGQGPWRRHVVTTRRRVDVKKTASGIAVVFK